MNSANMFKNPRSFEQHGFSLLEFLIAMTVLTIGVGGLLPLLLGAITIDKKAAGDTTSTMVAEVVLEQISSQSAATSTAVTITDCANNSATINVVDQNVGSGSGGTYGGNGAALTYMGIVDWTQAYASVPTGYAMQYVACSTTNDTQVTYDVRWDVITTSQSENTKLVVISARPVINSPVALGRIVIPVNLRTLVGM
jgi:type IV pilus modification protein PilV